MIRFRTQLLFLLVGLSAACGYGMRAGATTSQELIFADEPALVVDAVWQHPSQTWVHRQGAIRAYPQNAVTEIKPHIVTAQFGGWRQLRARAWDLRWQAFIFLNTHRPLGRAWSPRHLDIGLAISGILLGLLLYACGRQLRRHRGGSGRNADARLTEDRRAMGQMVAGGRSPGHQKRPDSDPQERVVAFFLQLFQAQCVPGRPSQGSFTANGSKGPHGTVIYDLYVRVQGKRHHRRMSIGPLGPGRVGSSLCFFVIYDIHMVVKLPRTPIEDYGLYIEAIDKERRLAARLGRIPTIVPRVTTILETVHRFNDHETLSADATERRYIGWMRRNPAFQRYLKVGDSFAFFMELSSHHFLHHVFQDLHIGKDRFMAEIRDHGHLIWKPHEFIGRYGAAAQPVCAQLQGVYQNCRRSLNLPNHPMAAKPVATDYQQKQDFLAGLQDHIHASKPAPSTASGGSDMRSLVGEQAGILGHYRRILKRYLSKTLFLHHRQQIGSLVTNTLELIASLNHRRIALRDLKPENLLVVGKASQFPAFLKRPERFHLGLIDLETATALATEGGQSQLLSTPKPGGTPLYATPTHFLSAATLGRIYTDPFEILMEQDWYAAIAICFRAVTGEHLWEGTAGLFPALVEMIAGATPDETPDGFENLFSKLSWVFWSNARMEFNDKLRRHRPALAKVKLVLSPRCLESMHNRIHRRIDGLNQEMTALTGAHEKLGEVVHHLQLTDATVEQIRLLRTTWEMDATADSKQSYHLSDRFRELEGLSQNLETLTQGRELLESAEDGIDLLPLLGVMFAHCLSLMYKGEWKGLGHRRIDWHEALMDEPSYTQTL